MELAVVFQVVADLGILRHADVLVQNSPPQFRAPADIAVVQDHVLIDYRAGMHAHAARQNGGTHHPAREKTAADKAKEDYPRADHDYGLSWIRREGKGRVFYEAHGHSERVYAIKPMLEHVLAGVQYALGDLKADDSPSVKAK